jgi:hypothetical protein
MMDPMFIPGNYGNTSSGIGYYLIGILIIGVIFVIIYIFTKMRQKDRFFPNRSPPYAI